MLGQAAAQGPAEQVLQPLDQCSFEPVLCHLVWEPVQRGADLTGASAGQLAHRLGLEDLLVGMQPAGLGELAAVAAELGAQPGAGRAGRVQGVELAPVDVADRGQRGGPEAFLGDQQGGAAGQCLRAGELDRALGQDRVDGASEQRHRPAQTFAHVFYRTLVRSDF